MRRRSPIRSRYTVRPSRADLPALDRWSELLLTKLRASYVAQLHGHWKLAFCDRPSFSTEDAARCAYGSALPGAGRQALLPLFGDDVDRVIASFAARSHGARRN